MRRWAIGLALIASPASGQQAVVNPLAKFDVDTMPFAERSKRAAVLKAARIGCRPQDMAIDERAFTFFVVQAKAAGVRALPENEAMSIFYADEAAEAKSVTASGGDLWRTNNDPAAIARHNEYWRAKCDQLKRDPFMSNFFISQAEERRRLLVNAPYVPSGPRCYKDYCPCQGPQNSLDKMLCDRIEEGLSVNVESMITGRSIRSSEEEMEALKERYP